MNWEKSIHTARSTDIEEMFLKHYSPLCNFALNYVNDRFTAEDIVQNLFIELWEKNTIEQIDIPERFLLRSVKFKCIDFLRQHKSTVDYSLIPELSTEEPQDLNEEDIDPLLHYFAAKLPPKTRQVFMMSRMNNLTYAEIAKELDISQKTVENQMSRALKTLRKLLKENDLLSLFFLI
ncbi:RNA polymerase sigma-70 factor [Puteibacter caeruleilacunae]|nr:RNA polymerase sigma-70 factor [Puteibacter caeruleilacunae]